MDYDYNEFPKRQSVGEHKQKIAKWLAKQKKNGEIYNPITVKSPRVIASSFWGQAWCRNIESYRDLDYRLARGRSYLRTGALVDLKIEDNIVFAKVLGESLYNVQIRFDPLSSKAWDLFISKCRIETISIVDLLSGKIPNKVLSIISSQNEGLFPQSKAIHFSCTCFDGADVCKHVAATLYGIGVLFDQDAKLFFSLRGVNASDLVENIKHEVLSNNKEIGNDDLGSLFDIEIGH